MVKNTMLNVVFPVTYQLQFPNLLQAKNSYIINIQYMFSHRMKDKYSALYLSFKGLNQTILYFQCHQIQLPNFLAF